MNRHSLLVAALCASVFGCATPPEPHPGVAAAASANPPADTAPARSRARSITGSRLPPLDDDDASASSVSAVSKDDYMHDNDARIKILNGEPGRGQ